MKDLIVKYFELSQQGASKPQMEAFIKSSGLNLNKISQISGIIISINSAFNSSFTVLENSPDKFPKVFAELLEKYLAQIGLNLNTIPKDLIFGIIEASLIISNQIMEELSQMSEEG